MKTMNPDFVEKLYQSHREYPDCPSPQEISNFFSEIMGLLFSDHSDKIFQTLVEFELHIDYLKLELTKLLTKSPDANISRDKIPAVVNEFFKNLQLIHNKLLQDVYAMYKGDPAAKSEGEVIRTYPGFYAIAAYRIAHSLHKLNIGGIPRVITEHAHSKTGIDIHPGAKIGDHFCIDHGTGVVIGETTVIGNHVKIYQGVTLGALSVDKADAIKKRHPTIADGVVIYAGATILGGDTVIGRHSVVGGNVWITRSVPPFSKIYYQPNEKGAETPGGNHQNKSK
jgi:serine O-acetyltransferase